LGEQQGNDKTPIIHYEGGIPIIDARFSEIERKQTEAESRDKGYKNEQITLNKRLVNATIALVIATIVMGAIGGIQLWYIHRQWKLTSDGLSKMGDQIWAANNAANASTRASETASQALKNSESSFKDTLTQMKAQTTAQQKAADTANIALHVSERAYVSVEFPMLDREKMTLSVPLNNSGRIPSGSAEVVIHEMTADKTSDGRAATIVECHWKRNKLNPIVPGSSLTGRDNPVLLVPLRDASLEKILTNSQIVIIAGWITYNDGFPDDRTETKTFCSQTMYHLIQKELAWISCDPTSIIPQIETKDGYPNNEQQ